MTNKSGMFSLTLFLSAGLMFAVQPMLGKMLLPMVGGAPSGWLTALAFFQIGLLGGYWVAHMLSRYPARAQGYATLGLLVLGAVMLPPHLTAGSDSNIGSALQVLTLLLTGISLPYVALSTVSSGLQRLYAAGEKTAGEKPYFLYAASNLGSFAGLLSYPFIVEPSLPLTAQSVVWACGYGLLIVLVGGLLLLPVKKEAAAEISAPAEPALPTPIKLKLKWLVLAFVPSSLSMGLTALITADLGSVPLFWVVPLALYLLTFVIAFGRGWKPDEGWLELIAGVLLAIQIVVLQSVGIFMIGWIYAVLPIAIFLLTALRFHTRLASLAPDESRLTEFYLWLALGGALGGIFNAFLAPALFPYPMEFWFVAIASMFSYAQIKPAGFLWKWRNVLALGVFLYGLAVPAIPGKIMGISLQSIAMLAGLLLLMPLPRQFAAVALAMAVMAMAVFWGVAIPGGHRPIAVARDFFGTLLVRERADYNGDLWHLLVSGSGVHGMQRMTPQPDVEPGMNFTSLQKLFDRDNVKDVGLIGLGVGMSLCFKKPGRKFTVYEIDQKAINFARNEFTYIEECGEPRWRLGDGRLELQRDKDARYDLLMVDAFAGTAVPVHLLTREALAVYDAHLKRDGIAVFNINSLFYDFNEPLAAIAHEAGWQAWRRNDDLYNPLYNTIMSNWVLLARGDQDLSHLETSGWRRIDDDGYPVWRDDYVNLLGSLKVFHNAQTH